MGENPLGSTSEHCSRRTPEGRSRARMKRGMLDPLKANKHIPTSYNFNAVWGAGR
jgi:hypothetical protein